MDSFTYSDSQSLNPPATFSLSDSSSTYGAAVSDEEVILASSRPKKRAGRKKFRETRHPVYRGVRQRNGNWVCEMREPNKKSRIWLGTFLTAEMAARAHDVASLALRGRSACLNFADSAWRLPVPESRDAKDIQKAAAEAAEAFRPSKSDETSCDTVRASKFEGMCFDTAQSEKARTAPESLFYVDDETLFEMPRLLNNMAEGLLISPPYLDGRFSCEDREGYADMSLWSYSV